MIDSSTRPGFLRTCRLRLQPSQKHDKSTVSVS